MESEAGKAPGSTKSHIGRYWRSQRIFPKYPMQSHSKFAFLPPWQLSASNLGVIIGNSLLDVSSEVGEGGTISRKDKRALSSSALTSGSSREKFWAISGA